MSDLFDRRRALTVVVLTVTLLSMAAAVAPGSTANDARADTSDDGCFGTQYTYEHTEETRPGYRRSVSTTRTTECAPHGPEFPPRLVTGHTVFALWDIHEEINITRDAQGGGDFVPLPSLGYRLGDPTPFVHEPPQPSDATVRANAAAGGTENGGTVSSRVHDVDIIQAECLVLPNGFAIDDVADPFGAPPGPSDADDPWSDTSQQDWDMGDNVEGCGLDHSRDPDLPWYGVPSDLAAVRGRLTHIQEVHETIVGVEETWTMTLSWGNYAVAVEHTDCNPAEGSDFRFRAHLDFVDEIGIYHEVQEYDYVCPGSAPQRFAACDESTSAGSVPDDELFVPDPSDPFGGSQQRHAEGAADQACHTDLDAAPDAFDPARSLPAQASALAIKELFPWTYRDDTQGRCEADLMVTQDPYDGLPRAYVEDQHRCNGTIQDLFTERLWITRTHAPAYDLTTGTEYTFMLLADTCDGRNVHEHYTHDRAFEESLPLQLHQSTWLLLADDELTVGPGACTTGSSFSFDDTSRGTVFHDAAPVDLNDVMHGNSFEFDYGSFHLWQHRADCRVGADSGGPAWPYNHLPFDGSPTGLDVGGPPVDPLTCYAEDHKTASVDLYVFEADPTGLFEIYATTPPSGPY